MKKAWIVLLLAAYLGLLLKAQPGNPLFHMENDELVAPPYPNKVSFTMQGDYRIAESNGVPHHLVGAFPGPGNPNTIREQHNHFKIPMHPHDAGQLISIETIKLFGIALDGVVFDPGTAAYWHNDQNSIWHVEAIVQGRRDLGLDQSYGHVQPNGAYHYHGRPVGLIQELGKGKGMTQIGWASDGYPIYDQTAYQDAANPNSPLVKLKPSYRLKSGERPGGADGPGGAYDGTYTGDYEYVPGLGDLDPCNGRTGVTPEFSQGTYYYVVTDSYPYVPRFFKATPDQSFNNRPHHPGGPGRDSPGGPGRPGGFGPSPP